MGLDVLCCQAYLLQRCHPACCVVTKDISISPRLSPIYYVCMYVCMNIYRDNGNTSSSALTFVPSPSETWFRGMSVGGSFRRVEGRGLTLERSSNWLPPPQSGLSVETRRQYGWLRMVFSGGRLFRAPTWWPSGGWRHARGREHCRGEPGTGSSLSGGYAPDSAKAEGSSIVDEPGEG